MDGKKEVHPISPIAPERILVPSRKVYSDPIACATSSITFRFLRKDRDDLKKFLNEQEIPAMIYYPVPLHLQKAYRDSRYPEGHFPVTETLCKQVISLPMHSELGEEQLSFICEKVREFFGK